MSPRTATRQIDRVEAVAVNAGGISLPEIVEAIHLRFGVWDSEAAVSDRLRDLRKRGYVVSCKPRVKGMALREYRVTPPGTRDLFGEPI